MRERRDVHSIHPFIYMHTYIYVNVYCLYFRIKETTEKERKEKECSVVHPSIYTHISNNLYTYIYTVRSKKQSSRRREWRRLLTNYRTNINFKRQRITTIKEKARCFIPLLSSFCWFLSINVSFFLCYFFSLFWLII